MSGGPSALLAGQAACLAAAFLWAVAVGLFRRPLERHGARAVNLAKCLLAALLQGLTVWALGLMDTLQHVSNQAIVLLSASGVIGLVVGDTALFGAVGRIGVHKTLLLQTLAPVFTALVALLWLGETMGLAQVGGALVILCGIALVVYRKPDSAGDGLPEPPRNATPRAARAVAGTGLLLGVLAAFGQGAGVILAKEGMHEVPVLPASFLRLGVAALGLLIIEAVAGRLGRLVGLLRDRTALVRAVPATVLGTYLALFLMMAGVALAPAPVAAVLLGTSPVFSLFLEALLEKRPITARGLVGTLLAVIGVGVLSTL